LLETYPALRQRLDANRAGLYMADLIHHMLTDHDPHPKVYEIFTQTLTQMREPGTMGISLLAFQLNLLSEAGYEPILDRDAQTGLDLDVDEPTLAFSAVAGGTVADNGEGDRWRVRAETIRLLQQVARNEVSSESMDAQSVERANRLLAAYIREIIGTEPAAFRWRFPDLSA
ncbi:MAG: DNA repair protein RecO, partial [Planctomycetota bacterium]|nr:DNA repair protein RecO [Planctomycetota bacterium]